MRLNKTVTGQLKKTNLKDVQVALDKVQVKNDIFGLLLLIADVMDNIAGGSDFYMVIGSTQKKDAFSFTIKGTDAPGAVYSQDLAGLSKQALDLL